MSALMEARMQTYFYIYKKINTSLFYISWLRKGNLVPLCSACECKHFMNAVFYALAVLNSVLALFYMEDD